MDELTTAPQSTLQLAGAILEFARSLSDDSSQIEAALMAAWTANSSDSRRAARSRYTEKHGD